MRRQLIADAEKAHASGDHVKALSLAQRASALEATPSLHYFIAREEEETGAFADGYGTAQQCEIEAQHDLQLRGREEILKKCREIEGRLKERVGYVVVDVKERPTGLRVKLSGQDLNDAALGIPYVITPGTIVVEATAPAHSPYRIEIEVPEGKTVNVSVTLAPKGDESAATNSCPVGQRRDPQDLCVADSCEVGMLRTADNLHCCWPGQIWDPAQEKCAGVARCPGGTRPEGGGCASEAKVSSPPSPAGTTPLPATSASVTVAGAEPEKHKALVLPIVLVSAGGAALIASAVTWFMGGSAVDDYTACNNVCSQAEIDSRANRVHRFDLATDITGAAGISLVLAGTIYYFYDRRYERTSKESAFSPDLQIVPRGQTTVGLRIRF